MAACLLLWPVSATAFLTTHVATTHRLSARGHLSLSRPIVMKVRDDTTKAAAVAAEAAEAAEAAAAAAAADPEPGPCITCGDPNTYWDGMVTFACTSCGHEWGIEEAKAVRELTQLALKPKPKPKPTPEPTTRLRRRTSLATRMARS